MLSARWSREMKRPWGTGEQRTRGPGPERPIGQEPEAELLSMTALWSLVWSLRFRVGGGEDWGICCCDLELTSNNEWLKR
mmetsp:Transcript_46971/g.73510  ORF Transcript_46971/g.73510 Transcript_46971/m.73510 type:complete len:80 (+) Transcript_46971:2006-2245(+)